MVKVAWAILILALSAQALAKRTLLKSGDSDKPSFDCEGKPNSRYAVEGHCEVSGRSAQGRRRWPHVPAGPCGLSEGWQSATCCRLGAEAAPQHEQRAAAAARRLPRPCPMGAAHRKFWACRTLMPAGPPPSTPSLPDVRHLL